MTDPSSPSPSSSSSSWSDPDPDPGAGEGLLSGGRFFGGVLMLICGILGVLQGIAGIAQDDVYANVGRYVFRFDLIAWGWIHLAIGVLLVAAGVGVLLGQAWGRVLGVVITALMVPAQFMWLPYQPFWAVINIGIGVFLIWALCSRDFAEPDA